MTDDIRAEILTTDSPYKRSARIFISAPAREIFNYLADPRKHHEFDGSGTVVGHVSGPERLQSGSRFGMSMRIKAPYRVLNTVREFELDRRIAWSHFNRHRWRYELEPAEGGTWVTETFDGSTAWFPPALQVINAYENNQIAIAKTLVRLKRLLESA